MHKRHHSQVIYFLLYSQMLYFLMGASYLNHNFQCNSWPLNNIRLLSITRIWRGQKEKGKVSTSVEKKKDSVADRRYVWILQYVTQAQQYTNIFVNNLCTKEQRRTGERRERVQVRIVISGVEYHSKMLPTGLSSVYSVCSEAAGLAGIPFPPSTLFCLFILLLVSAWNAVWLVSET